MTGAQFRLSLPLAILFAFCFIAPLTILVVMSFSDQAAAGGFTLGHYRAIFTDPFNLSILLDTLLLGVKATLLCLLFGYPVAWVASRASPRWQSILLFMVVLPIMTSVVVRTFSWIVILGRNGVLNRAMLALGMIDEPVRLLFSETAVVVVLAQVQMPLMVLPILTAIGKIDPNLSDASRALGAGEWRTFRRVTLPLSMPGIIAGCLLTYSACVTAFVTQSLIGGARLLYMPLRIYQQAVGANDWPFAAALSITFMIAVVLVAIGLNMLSARSSRHAQS
ncbi:MAG: ABC transporter permease [Sphingobium sp.]